MSTTIDQPTEVAAELAPLVSQPDKSVLYMSRRSDLRLVMKARYPMIAPATGARIGETRGITVAFIEGALRVPIEGTAKVFDPGGAGEAELPAADLIEWLDGHRRNGDVNEGFWRVDPTAPPVSAEEMNRIVMAATDWKVDVLRAVIEQEKAGWNREDIFKVAQGSIDRIEAMEARVEEEAAAQASAAVEGERAAREQSQRNEQAALQQAQEAQRELEQAKAEAKKAIADAEAARKEAQQARAAQATGQEPKPEPKGKAK